MAASSPTPIILNVEDTDADANADADDLPPPQKDFPQSQVCPSQPVNPQLASSFFTRLPCEVRKLIFAEFWRTDSLSQHIYEGLSGAFSSCACWTDPRDPDERFARFEAYADDGTNADAARLWRRRCRSDWSLHWRCEEEDEVARWTRRAPHIPVLTACQRFYEEGLESLLESTTFVFTDVTAAKGFLATWVHAPLIQNISLAFRMTASFTDFYRSGTSSSAITTPTTPLTPRSSDFDEDRAATVISSSGLSASNNAWESLCTALANKNLPRLRKLHVWLDSKDLRAWHVSVAEKRLLASLVGGDVRPRLEFILALPSITEEDKARSAKYAHYDDGEAVGHAVVSRGPRPHNWRLYLSTRAGNLRDRGFEDAAPLPSRLHEYFESSGG